MSAPAAKQGDMIVAIDTHVTMVPSPAGPVPTPTPMPFRGKLERDLSADVRIENEPAATKGSRATNSPPHAPAGGPFQWSPKNEGTVEAGSGSVLINNKQAARMGDPAVTCSDPADAPNGIVIASGSVLVGG